jgi:nucleoside-diphosphate-sugar epimerase
MSTGIRCGQAIYLLTGASGFIGGAATRQLTTPPPRARDRQTPSKAEDLKVLAWSCSPAMSPTRRPCAPDDRVIGVFHIAGW